MQTTMNNFWNRSRWRVAVLMFLTFALNVVAQNKYDVRLVGSDNTNEGRVEVYNNNTWGTICDDDFDNDDVTTICKQLGFTNGGVIAQNITQYGTPSLNQPIHFKNLQCSGQEEKLEQCSKVTIQDNSCTHDEDVHIVCNVGTAAVEITDQEFTIGVQEPICQSDQIRIRGPVNMRGIGYIEVFHPQHGGWGAVCDDFWDSLDAQVACGMLCFPNPHLALAGDLKNFDSVKATVSKNILLDNVHCTGTEKSIFDCKHNGIGIHNCNAEKMEFASVKCTSVTTQPITMIPPDLECFDDMFNIKFSLDADPNLLEEHLTLYDRPKVNPEPCLFQYVRNSEYLSIQLKYHECDTVVSTNTTHISYSTHILYNCTTRSSEITRMPNVIYKFICDIPRNLTDSIDYVFKTINETYRGEAKFTINMTLYKDKYFQEPVIGTPTFVLGQHATAAVNLINSNPEVWLVVPKCYATPISDPESLDRQVLFEQNCPVEATTCLHPLSMKSVGFEWKVFSFKGYSEVDFHCYAVVCDIDEKSNLCDRTCSKDTNNRRKRAPIREKRETVYVSRTTSHFYVQEIAEKVIERDQEFSNSTNHHYDGNISTLSTSTILPTVSQQATSSQSQPSIKVISSTKSPPTSAWKTSNRESTSRMNRTGTTPRPLTTERHSPRDLLSGNPKEVTASGTQENGSCIILSIAAMVALSFKLC